MSLSAFSYYYIIACGLNIVVLGYMIILLFTNFFKKRTVGTFLLILAYGSVFLNEILSTVAFLHEAIFPGDPRAQMIAKIFHILGVFSLVYSINWIYFFSNRHLIRDNDLFKSLYTSIFGGFIGAIGALAIQNVIQDYNRALQGLAPTEIWYSTIHLEGADFNLYLPSIEWPQIVILGALFLIGSITYLRLIFRTLQLQRKAIDIVQKKGLRVVSVSILLLLLTGIVLGAYIFGAGNNAILSSLFYVLRGLIVIAAVITGYIGWIMPEWVRKRFRGKAWITKIYTGKLPEPKVKPENISPGSNTSHIIEVSEL